LILDDPKNKNALSEKMMHQLQQRIFEASSNGSVKVIIIAAVGMFFVQGII
jgi:enoyl-CoA hydratase/carnithine racemase